MDFNSTEFADFLKNIIKDISEKTFASMLKSRNIMTSWVGKVSAVNSTANTADILFPNQTTTVTKQNKTGQTLAVNDEVYLISPTGDLNNSYIGSKKTAPKAIITTEGGIAIKLINKTGSASVKGTVVDVNSGLNNSVKKVLQNTADAIGVIYEDGIADGQEVLVVVSGIADVLFIGNTTPGYIARTFLTADAGYITGYALAETYPTAPFSSDKHFCEIGHVLETRTGAGLAKTVLHFN